MTDRIDDLPRIAGAPQPEPPQMGRGTLGRRLVLQVAALVALVAVALSALTTLAVDQLMLHQLDAQVASAANRTPGPSPDQGGDERRQQVATLLVALPTSGAPVGIVLNENGRDTLAAATVQQVARAVASHSQVTVSLPQLGRYRLQSRTYPDGVLVAGLPTAQMDRVLFGLVGLEAVLTALAMGGAALGARALVARSLRPLNRLASTATQVSRLELDRGEVALGVRVPAQDTDPRSEVGRVGDAFNHMLSNVDGALAARQASERKLRQFVADASHELRNPLAAIRGYAELTRRSRAELRPDVAYAMSRVESEAERMSHLVQDLLLLARLDSGPNLDLRPTDLTEIVANATSDARAAGPGHRWSLDLPSQPVVVSADGHRIHQVVANLLANAATHTPAGTNIRAGLRTEDAQAVITVTDDGPGIPPDVAGRVFERFTRADTSRARAAGQEGSGSTGLGLAIVAAVVTAHGGRVWVESRPGATCFSVALPQATSSPASLDGSQGAAPSAPDHGSLNPEGGQHTRLV